MKPLVTLLCVLILFAVHNSYSALQNNVDPPGAFSLLEPAHNSYFVLSDPLTPFQFRWEDVLGLEDGSNEKVTQPVRYQFGDYVGGGFRIQEENDLPTAYYIFSLSLDEDFELMFDLDALEQPYLEVLAGDFGFLFALLKYITGTKPDTLHIYWTVTAVNEGGTTAASDTFRVSVSIDSEPPSENFALLYPPHGETVEIKIDQDTNTPLEEDVTFRWNAAPHPTNATVYYFWVMSDTYPLPSFLEYTFENGDGGDNNGNDPLPLYFFFPSGNLSDGEEGDWEMGGTDTLFTLPNEIIYYWFLGGRGVETTFYWTVIASDGFRILNWVPSADTSSVTFKPIFVSNVEGKHLTLPRGYELQQNYPNPFNPSTTIRLALPEQSVVTLEIYNILGQHISTIVDGQVLSAGYHQFAWDGTDSFGRELPSGVYLYHLRAGGHVETKRMLLLR